MTAMVNNTDTWIDLCALADVPIADGEQPAGGHYVLHNDHAFAAWRFMDGTVRVMDDVCPHAGASLSAGHFNPQENCVVCPWHGWYFNRDHGRCPDNEDIAVKVYEVRVEGARVFIKV